MSSSLGPQVLATKTSEPAWSFPGKAPPKRPSGVPGVGAYEATSSLGKQVTSLAPTSPIISFSRSPRKPAGNTSGAPGPGAYESPAAFGTQPRSEHASAPSFSMKSRIVVGGDASSPGPGDYEVVPGIGKQVTKRNYPEFSMTGRPAVRMADDMPGPGEHETAVPAAGKQPLSTHPSAPTYSLGARRFIKVKDEADALGPGVCRTDGAFGKQPYSVKRSAPTYTFGARTPAGFSPVRSKNPGPGAHNVAPAAVGVQVNSRIRTSPAFSLSSRPRVIVDRSAPGPGHYEDVGAIGRQPVSSRRSAPAYRFGASASRKSGYGSSAPGPGTYDLGDIVAKRAMDKSLTMRGREKFGSPSLPKEGPGPGAYGASPRTKKSPPAFSFPNSKRKPFSKSFTPGPGHYSASRPTTSPAFSISARHPRARKQWERDGPGRCREGSMFGRQTDSGKRSHGGFSFGSRTPLRQRDTTPGPGAYQSFSRGVLSVPLGRKLNLTGKKKKKKKVKRRRRARKKRVSSKASQERSASATNEGDTMNDPSGYF